MPLEIKQEAFNIRLLEAHDYSNGFLECLSELTIVGETSEINFIEQYINMTAKSKDYHVYVMTNTNNQVIGAGTLLIERKFIHEQKSVGHIEDVVVLKTHRKMGLGERITKHLLEKGKELGCYKVILDCSKDNVGFYEKCGMKEKGIQMALYFD